MLYAGENQFVVRTHPPSFKCALRMHCRPSFGISSSVRYTSLNANWKPELSWSSSSSAHEPVFCQSTTRNERSNLGAPLAHLEAVEEPDELREAVEDWRCKVADG